MNARPAEKIDEKRDVARSGGPSNEPSGSSEGRLRRWWRRIPEPVKSIGGAILLFLLIRTFLIQTYTITSGSMRDTLLVGDFLVVSKAAYGAEVPGTDIDLPGYESLSRGEVVVFQGPHQPELDLVKRLIGLPGDTLAMRDGVVYLNGERLVESYVERSPHTQVVTHAWMVWQKEYLALGVDPDTYQARLWNWGPIVVPPDHYFMMGDNRDDSFDSRYWGFVPRELIKGKALIIYYSYNRRALDPFPWIQDVRWGRIGNTFDAADSD